MYIMLTGECYGNADTKISGQNGALAQLVEHIVHIDGVTGSSPVSTTILRFVSQETSLFCLRRSSVMEIVELDQLTIHTETKDITLSQLKEMVDANDIITNPDYQRNYVYDDKRASLLVESILIGIPIPIIYLCEEAEGTFSVIDGQQRIMSFTRYLKNEFALTGLSKLLRLNGLYFRDLEKAIQRRLRAKSLKAICLDRDSQALKYEIFSRLNLGAVKLKDQEVRNCIFRGSFNTMLRRIADTDENVKILFHHADNKRMEFEERILRFFAMRDFYNVSGTFKDTMNRFMDKHKNDSKEEIAKLEEQYRSVVDAIKQVLGEEAFFFQGERASKFNGAVYDSIIIPFSLFPKRTLLMHADKIREGICDLKANDAEYRENVYVGTNAGRRVRGRITKVIEIITRCTGPDTVNEPRCFDTSIRQKLFAENPICAICGNRILSIEDCEVDHIIPFSLGGSTSIENAQLTHRTCNRGKSNYINDVNSLIIDTDVTDDG